MKHQRQLCDFFELFGYWSSKDSLFAGPWHWHEGMGGPDERGVWGPEPNGFYQSTVRFRQHWASIHDTVEAVSKAAEKAELAYQTMKLRASERLGDAGSNPAPK